MLHLQLIHPYTESIQTMSVFFQQQLLLQLCSLSKNWILDNEAWLLHIFLTRSAHATEVTVSESAVRSHRRVTCEVQADHR